MATGSRRRPGALAVALATALTCGMAAQAVAAEWAQRAVNPDAQARAEFLERVDAYMQNRAALQQRLEAGPRDPAVPPLEMLARLIVQSRPAAQQGEFFSSDVRRFIRRQIARALARPEGPQIRASIMDENPGRLYIRINGRYPDSAPLASMPPQVLAELPKLPTELEYRFIGRRLILMDVDAHLVLDYMDNALRN